MAKLSPQQIAGYAKAAGFPDNELATAVAVAFAESGGEPTSTNRANRNGSVDYGLWQINSVHGPLLATGDKFNPADNARMAYTVWKGAGGKWTPWSAYNNQRYRAYIPQATLGAAQPTMPSGAAPGATPSPGPTGAVPGTESTGEPAPPTGILGTLMNSLGLDGVYSLVQSAAKFIIAIPKLIATLLSPGLWLRMAAFVAGSILVMFSIVKLSGLEGAAKSAVSTAVAVGSKGIIK